MILLIVGKSGSGKTSVEHELIKSHGYNRVVTCTTRKPREGEDKDSYHFMSREEFMLAVDRGDFLEYDNYRENMYGTLKDEFKDASIENKMVCVVTPEGAMAIKRVYPGACIMYLATELKDSIMRVIGRAQHLTPLDLRKACTQAATDEYLYNGIKYDIIIPNPADSKLWDIARTVADEHMKWEMHNMMKETNDQLREGLELLKDTYLPDRERCTELLEGCIGTIMDTWGRDDGIRELLQIGFTRDELVKGFSLSREDVDRVLEQDTAALEKETMCLPWV